MTKWLLILLFSAVPAIAETDAETQPNRKLNFALVYSVQWGYYWVDQNDLIRSHGSFRNWVLNPFSPRLDRDDLEFNVLKHTWTGHYYYLFYRSQGESRENAFLWAAISSAAFEFTVETVTERPSYQDLFVTPAFGGSLGVVVERASEVLRAEKGWLSRTLGTILNPFSLVAKGGASPVAVSPVVSPNYIGAYWAWEF